MNLTVLPEPPAGGWPSGAPASDYERSPAAARVGRLAAEAGLFLFHFEHRAHLELPEDWGGGPAPAWEGGVLPEPKYQAFRHDLPIGSFHPGHRAKWTTHELCHGLVGFAWRPDASRFFHATAARLAELLPVVLWYFLDEMGLRRCPDHAERGALFRTHCEACEEVASARPGDPEAPRLLAEARAFLDRELAAVARSRRLGRVVPHTWATLDLSSDGIAYAASHDARLGSRAFAELAERFFVEGGGWHRELDALEARVVEVFRALIGEGEAAPLAPSAAEGRRRWILQDVAWRLLTVAHESEGEVAAELRALVDGLAAGGVEQAVAGYRALHEEWVLPEPERVFAVGYPLGALGSDVGQLVEGVRSALPNTARALGAELEDRVASFAREDVAVREPLGRRFARWLGAGPVAELARFEAAVAHPPAGDRGAAAALGWRGGEGARLAPHVTLHRFTEDVVALAEGGEPAPGDRALLVGRVGDEVGVWDLDPETADRLEAGTLTPEEVEILRELGVLVPERWR